MSKASPFPPAATPLVVLVLASAVLPWASWGALADGFDDTGAHLTPGRRAVGAVWTGQYAFVFGGLTEAGGVLGEVVRFDPDTGAVAVVSTALKPRMLPAVAWDGTHVYVFGGNDGGLRDVVRFNPLTNALTTMQAVMPWGLSQPAAAWDGAHIYVFDSGSLFRYHPASDSIVSLPGAPHMYAHVALWDGQEILLLGAGDGHEVWSYKPATEAFRRRAGYIGGGTGGFWDGHNAFAVADHRVYKFDPQADTVTLMSAPIPGGRVWGATAWDGERAYIFGGQHPDGAHPTSILRYSLAPAAPGNPSLEQGPGLAELTLRWDAPAADTYSVLTGYRVYRATQEAGPYALLATLGAGTTTYTDRAGLVGTYYYRVTAINAGRDEGPASATVSGAGLIATCPPPPHPAVEACINLRDRLADLAPAGLDAGLTGAGHRVVAYVDTYTFALPGGGNLVVPCVVPAADATSANACAVAGARFRERILALVDQRVNEPRAGVGPPAFAVGVCTATLTLGVAGFGVQGVPVVSPC